MRNLPRLAARVFNTPLAIAPDKAAVIAAVITSRMGGAPVQASAEPEPEIKAPAFEVTADGIACIQICGTLVEKSSWLDAYSGLVGYDSIAQQVAVAEGDARVKGILLVIDSPGGEVSGMFECAKSLAAAKKPVHAAVAFSACSAAYLLAAQSERIAVTESSLTGSIGVIAQHMEMSGWDTQAGLKYNTIFAGARKNDGNLHEPLSKDARAAIQADVDDVMDQFVSSVAAARGMAEADVRATEAGVFRGEKAIAAGLADAMGTPADALRTLVENIANPNKAAAAAKENPMSGLTAKAAPVEEPKVPEEEKKTPPEEQAKKPEGEKKPEGDGGEAGDRAAQYETIAAMCEVAGKPELAAGFISKRASVADVRKALLDAKASGAAPIQSRIDPSVGASAKPPAALNDNPLLADAKNRRAAAEAKKGAR